MNESRSSSTGLKYLTQMHPPSGIVLVGAGDGSGEWADFLVKQTDAACLLVEAEQTKYDILRAVTAGHPLVRVLNEVIAKDAGEILFHKTTVSSENSLVAPEELQSLWPNIRILEVEKRQGIPLRHISHTNFPVANWLLVDCLPALPIIEGFEDGLDSIRILVARVALSEKEAGSPLTSVDALTHFLGEKGFHFCGVWNSRHPLVGHACFLRADPTNAQKLERMPKEAPNVPDNTASKVNLCEPQQVAAGTWGEKKATHALSLAYYQKFDEEFDKDSLPPFVLIDSKSLPRSGVHYLKDTFRKLLGDQFSFCEWYQEIGCCKKHPCSLHAYAEYAGKTDQFRLRLTKSHDLDHSDPPLPTSRVLRRVALIRDPLFILTSWFELDQMAKNRAVLLQKGIDIRKIWLLHEKEINITAYEILGQVFEPPPDAELKTWLLEKALYINRFLMDWVIPSLSKDDPFCRVVRYEEIDAYVADLLSSYRRWLSDASLRALDQFPSQGSGDFSRRSDPYSLHASSLETYIRERKHLFEETIGHIISIPKKPSGRD